MWQGFIQSGFSPSVAIGGVGGSGTRLIAAIVRQAGFYMGADLNDANDNLSFTFLFKRPELIGQPEAIDRSLSIFLAGMNAICLPSEERHWLKALGLHPVAEFPQSWSEIRAKNILRETRSLCRHGGYWGWKEPNTHIFVDKLLARLPVMKYIHVMRNGLDMAYSRNQTQLSLWGRLVLSDVMDISPQSSLRYWCAVHRRMLQLKNDFPDRILLLNYDELCIQPKDGLEKIERFLGLSLTRESREIILRSVKIPKSVGRYVEHDIQGFAETDVEFVRAMGFAVA